MGTVDPAEECKGMNHPAHQDEYNTCLRSKMAIAAKEAGFDCEDCMNTETNKGPNGLVAFAGAIAQPLAVLAGAYTVAKFENDTQKKWAKAYESGYTECTTRFNSYLSYLTSVGANPMGTTEAKSMANSCNGNSYGSYAGLNGLTGNAYGGYGNPFTSTGFSSGFMSGYGGSFASGSSSIFNNGMLSGSIGVSGTLTTTTTGVTPAFVFQ